MKHYYPQFKHFQLVDSMIFGEVRSKQIFGALSKYFSGEFASAPLEKLARTPMEEGVRIFRGKGRNVQVTPVRLHTLR